MCGRVGLGFISGDEVGSGEMKVSVNQGWQGYNSCLKMKQLYFFVYFGIKRIFLLFYQKVIGRDDRNLLVKKANDRLTNNLFWLNKEKYIVYNFFIYKFKQ